MKQTFTFFQICIIISLLFITSNSLGQTYGIIGTGTSTADHPFFSYYQDSRTQILYTASELTAAGLTSGTITDIGFDINTVSSQTLNGFSIKVQNTSLTSINTFIETNWTSVFDNSYAIPNLGWDTIPLETPFVWDGTSNLLVQICFDNSVYTTSSKVNSTSISNMTVHKHLDNNSGCALTGGTTIPNRPNILFGIAPPVQTDLGITKFKQPNFSSSINPSNSVPIEVQIKNYGLAAQNNFDIKYSIDNGTTYTTESYTTTLNADDTLNYTFSQTADFSNQGVYNIIATVVLANDSNSNNDTLRTTANVCSTMNGTYNIGPGKDYSDLTTALNAVYNCGINGPTELLLEDGTYDATYEITPFSGSSATNTLTIKGSGENTILTNTQSTNPAIFKINGAKHIIIDNLKIIKGTTSTGFIGVWITNSADFNIVRNCKIENNNSAYSDYGILCSSTSTYLTHGNNGSKLLIENNNIIGGKIGIGVIGKNTTPYNSSNIIRNNYITDFSNNGIETTYQNKSTISNNTIVDGVNTGDNSYSLYLNYCTDRIEVNKNSISKTNSGYGFYLYSINENSGTNDSVFISNNMVSIHNNNTNNSTTACIYHSASNNVKYYNNTINMDIPGADSKAIHFTNSNSIDLYNNIITSSSGYAIYSEIPTTAITSNYNNIYTKGSKYCYLNANVDSLAAWQATTSQDANSISTNPYYHSASNLHASSSIMANKGSYISYITDDIDGESRSITTPDIGADEYTPPLYDVNTLAYIGAIGSSCALTNSETISIKIQNNGSLNLTNIPLSYKVDNGTTITEIMSSLNSNSIATFAFMAKADFSGVGQHSITVWADLTNDEIRDNDTIKVSLINTLSITNFPFTENFNNSNHFFKLLKNDNVNIMIKDVVGLNGSKAAYMTGGEYNGWNYSGSDFSQVIAQNSSHEAVIEACNIDASSLSGLKLAFKHKIQGYNNEQHWLWVTVNDTIVKDTQGDSVWNNQTYGYKNHEFDLSQFTGRQIQISLHGILSTENEDMITIDSISLWVPVQNDVGITNVYSPRNTPCGSTTDSVYAKIKNYGTNTQTNIPVTLNISIDGNHTFNKIYTGSIAENETDSVFLGVVNSTNNEWVDVSAYTSLSTDTNKTNDSLIAHFYNSKYIEIDFVENFDATTEWSFNNIFVQDPQYIPGLSSKAIALDVMHEHFNTYARLNKYIGISNDNSNLSFDIKFVSITSFKDTVLFIVEGCDGVKNTVFKIDENNVFNDTLTHSYSIPINSPYNDRFKISIEVKSTPGSTYFMTVDNYGITNSFEANIGNDTTLCFGDSLLLNPQLSTADGYQFIWNGPGGITNITTETIFAKTAGIYSVIISNNTGDTKNDTINVAFAAPLSASIITNKDSLCIGDSALLSVNLAGSFPLIVNWQENTNSHIDTITSLMEKTFHPIETTKYTIEKITDTYGCYTNKLDSITIIVNNNPNISLSDYNSSYCSNSMDDTITTSPLGGVYYGLNNQNGIIQTQSMGVGAKQVIYTYTNTHGCSNSDTINFDINQAPTVSITSAINTTYCITNDSIILTASPIGGLFAGSGITNNIVYLNSASSGMQNYTYTYTDLNGCSNSDTISTQINQSPAVSIGTLSDVCADQPILTLNGGTPVGGNYYGNAVATSSSAFYPSIAGAGTEIITYKYIDINGCQGIATTPIKVISTPIANFSIDANICKKDTTVINYTANASGTAIFTWNFNNGNIITGTGQGPYNISWDTAGVKNLSLIVSDSGCTSPLFNNFTNIIESTASASLIGNDSACFGDNITIFTNSGISNSYQWYDTSGNITSSQDTLVYFNASQSGMYYVKNTNTFGCTAISNAISVTINPEIISSFSIANTACKDDMVNINFTGTAGSSAIYNWNFNGGMIASGSNSGPYNIIWNTDSIKNVSLSIDENGCSSNITDNFISIETTPATITALNSLSFCNGGSASLSANSGSYSYEWFKNGISTSNTSAIFNATQSGVYTVKVTNNSTSCYNTSDSVVVTVNTDDFNIDFAASQTSFNIPPFNVNFSNQTLNVNDYYWMWSFGDGNSSTFVHPSHQYNFDGNYTVGVIAQNVNTGCFDTLIKTDYISCTGGSANPCSLDPSFNNIGGNQICAGDSIKLYATDHTTDITYQWLRDGIILAGATDSVYYASFTGLYQLMVVDTACSVFSQPFSLTQTTPIQPSIFTNGNIQPCTNDSMELYVSTSFNSYQWSNGSNSPSIFVSTSGSYIVTITDNNGCSSSSAPYVVNASLLQAPNICIVGIDTISNHNRIIWERENNNMVDSFKIYKESSVAGVYDLIGSQAFSTLSVFEDINSNPAQMAYRYRITAVDTCGMETSPSPIHKTLHLTVNAGLGGVWNLIWTNYEGFSFGSYKIYRSSDSTNMQLLTQIQSNLTSYTDLNPPSGNVYYQIEVMAPHNCYPDSIFTKVNTNYNSSRSNTANTAYATNTGIFNYQNNDIAASIYPNPSKGLFTLEISNERSTNMKLSIINTIGMEVYNDKFTSYGQTIKQIDLQGLAKGVYFINLQSSNGIIYRGKLIIN